MHGGPPASRFQGEQDRGQLCSPTSFCSAQEPGASLQTAHGAATRICRSTPQSLETVSHMQRFRQKA